ncbi:SdpI family protein [Paenibacillus riograndensis]|uniref:Putative membrane protein n=1 Tax=Paenibacillus riograndensis SBR5 TaxID=1073571 RepID=A0A0E4HEX2_9BACL|nr:SdpI family protein [Paenibacillus riograndensis]CQR58259.1 putative membrane protein [Paenibacillus riograndensis SBR5]
MKDFKWKWQDTVIVILGVLSLGYALANYGKLPDQLPAHFDIRGEADRYWSKGSVIAFTGFLGLIFPLAMQFIKSVDPKKENYSKFQNAYKMIRLAIAALFDAMLVLTVSYGLNQNIPAGKIAMVAIGLLFIVVGNFMPQIRDNYFTGIRTAWTLASPEVWRKTHRFSGVMWMIGGLLIALGAFLPQSLSISMIIAALVIAIILPFAYSWLISSRTKA